MLDSQFLNSLIASGSVPVILGLVEAFKRAGLNAKFYALTAIGIGIVVNVVVAWGLFEAFTKATIISAILQGIIAGLASSGLYSTGQVVIKNETGINRDELETLKLKATNNVQENVQENVQKTEVK